MPDDHASAPVDVHIRDESIRLGQLLKLAGLAEDGAQARELITGGHVQVDGSVETRRSHAVRPGSVVRSPAGSIRVAGPDSQESGDTRG